LPGPLSYLVFGAGAIGTYVGGQLALNGQHVGFIERPDVANKLRKDGLRLEIGGKQRLLSHPKVVTTIEEALRTGPFDVAIFALKSYDTEGALKNISIYSSSLPPFLCLQNGVENEQMLASVLGTERVIAGTVTSSVARRAAGDIILERNRGIGIYAGHLLSGSLSNALEEAGIKVRLYAQAADMKWSKMLTNLLANATAAILDMSPDEIFEHPGLYRLEVAQFREALAVMKAQRIRVVDLPGTPVRALSLAITRLSPGKSRVLLQRILGKGRGGKMPSLHIDLHNGSSRSEVGWLNGAVVRLGEAFGVPTPVNRVLNDTLQAIVARKIPPEKFRRRPDRLISLAFLD
jgi:2-dehydropantoate 2-reductase